MNRETVWPNIEIENEDALLLDCDVLTLKHAQALYGVDEAVVQRLEDAHPRIRAELPPPGGFRFYESPLNEGPRAFLFVGVPSLRDFLYEDMREFARKCMASLASRPDTAVIGMTLHGTGYGLDERECFQALLGGISDGFASGDYPSQLSTIRFAELNPGRVRRLRGNLDGLLPTSSGGVSQLTLQEQETGRRGTVFVAMPFKVAFDDVFYFGIKEPLNRLELACERIDQTAFGGSVVDEIRRRIRRAQFVVADLSELNPNVYLELGYAWGCEVPVILVTRSTNQLAFDTRGERCLTYRSAKELAGLLASEVAGRFLHANSSATLEP